MESASDELDWREACTRLSIAFANGIDRFDYPFLVSLFAEDGVLDRMGTIVRGRAELAAWLKSRPKDVMVRHVCTNIEIQRMGANEATGLTYFTFYRRPANDPHDLAGPDMVGEYHDRFRLTPDGWRIAERKVIVVFQRKS